MKPRATFMQVMVGLLGDGQTVRFRASGGSMHPTIRNHDIITVAPLGRSRIRVGDVVLYRRGRAAIAHRVIRLQAGDGRPQLVLRGDAARCCDRPVDPGHVLGRVTAVARGDRTRNLDTLGPAWSRAVGLTLRVARDFRMRATEIVIRRPTT